MTSTNVFPDPQSSVALLLRPPDGFEALYQGQGLATPLPFVAANEQGQYLPLDPRAGSPTINTVLLRYVTVPIGATLLLLIPRARYFTDSPQEGIYTYELRWRLRTVTDHNVAQEQRSDPTVPYNLIPRLGAPEEVAGPDRDQVVLPAYTSEAVVPTAPGNGVLPVVSTAAQPRGAANQGTYVEDSVGAFALANAPNVYFNPLLRRVLGNELSVVAYRTTGAETWDFEADDAGISNLYGTNLVTGGTPHPILPGVGMYLVFLAGSPAL